MRATAAPLFLIACVLIACVTHLAAQEPSSAQMVGTVVNSSDGEPLGLVQVGLEGTTFATVTGEDGRFALTDVPPGRYVLEAIAVGYHAVRQDVTLAAGQRASFDIVLTSLTLTVTESATVTASVSPFSREPAAAAGFTLEGHEIANLGSVLADDPLRAVKSLPGVTANNDFSSEFSVRGAPFTRVGLVWDGVLLHNPFHTTDGVAGNGSLSIFSGDLTDDMTLFQGAWPVRYGDRTAGLLEVRTRAGSRDGVRGQVSAGASTVDGVVEGPIGRSRRGSWIVAARKSYLQYILNRIDFGDQPPFVFGFADVQVKLDYDLAPAHTLSVTMLEGGSDVDRSRFREELNPTTVATSGFRTTVINVGWRYLRPTLLVTTRGAIDRERGHVENRDGLRLSRTHYREAVGRTDAAWLVHPRHTVELGGQVRRLAADGTSTAVVYAPTLRTVPDAFAATGWQNGAYAMDTVKLGRMTMVAGLRGDGHSWSAAHVLSPYASVAVVPRPGSRVQVDWGRYGQFADPAQARSSFTSARLRPERARHLDLLLQHELSPRTRISLDVFDRRDRDLLARPALEPRLSSDGAVIDADPTAPWLNTGRATVRGVQTSVQRRSANGFSGWLSYGYSRTEVRDATFSGVFPSDYDQRHTVNAFVSRRLTPTLNASGQFAFGTGMPYPGFYQRAGDGFALDAVRNRVRAPIYQRLDLRLNKALRIRRTDATLFVEVINVTNHENSDFDSPGPYDPATGSAQPNFFSMFPVLPSAGLVIRFGGRSADVP